MKKHQKKHHLLRFLAKLYLPRFFKAAQAYYETIDANLYQLLSVFATTRAAICVSAGPYRDVLLLHISMDGDPDKDGLPLYDLTEDGPEKGIRECLEAQGYSREEMLKIQGSCPYVTLSEDACAYLLEYFGILSDTVHGLIRADFALLLGPVLYGSLNGGITLSCNSLTSLVGATDEELEAAGQAPEQQGELFASEEDEEDLARRARIEEAWQRRLSKRSDTFADESEPAVTCSSDEADYAFIAKHEIFDADDGLA
jgi:hypothetical protein